MTEIAIVGAGPYGLSIAAHLRGQGIPFRIFGRPMESWLLHMPKSMSLKSDGFASNISDPNGELTLKKFCAERGLEFHAISAATGEGVKDLVRSMADALDKIPKPDAEIEVEQSHSAAAQDDFHTPA